MSYVTLNLRCSGEIGTLLSIVALVILIFTNLSADTIAFRNDFGTTLAVIRAFFENGEFPLLGPPSHAGGRHLGPIYYLYVAALYFITSGSVVAMVKLSAILKLLSIGWLVAVARKMAPLESRTWVGCGIIMTLAAGLGLDMFRTIWHSYELWIVLCPWIYVAFCCFNRSAKPLASYIFLSSLLVQFHFSTVPLVGIMTAFILIISILEQTLQEVIRELLSVGGLIYLALATLSWIPLLLWELNYPSMLFKQINLHLVSNQKAIGQPEHSYLEAIEKFYSFISNSLSNGSSIFNSLGVFEFIQGVAIVLLLSVLLVPILVSKGRSRNFNGAFLLSVVAIVLAVKGVSGPILAYFFQSLLPFVVIYVGVGVATLCSMVVFRGFALVVSMAWLILVERGITQNYLEIQNGLSSPRFSLHHAKDIAQIIAKDRNRLTENIKVIVRDQGQGRENAIYVNLPQIPYHQLAWRKFFKEIPQFSRVNVEIGEGYLLACGPKREQFIERHNTQVGKGWVVGKAISLNKCFGCAPCSMFELRKDASK